MKKGILAGFFGFLAFMGACTVIAKGIYKSGLPRVSVCQPEQKSLAYEIDAPGSVLPGREFSVHTVAGLRIRTVYVQAGDQVAAGDALFLIDLQDLEEQLRQTAAEQAYLQAQIGDAARQEKARRQEREAAADRLQAEYDSLVREWDLQIADRELEAEEIRRNMEQESQSVSGSDLVSAQLALQYERALNAVEEAKLQKDRAVRDWNRSLEDARREEPAQTAQTVRLQGDLATLIAKSSQLEALKEREGLVLAEEDGLILQDFLQIGERTPDGACMRYTVLGSGGEAEIPLGKGDLALFSIGDGVELQYRTRLGEKKNVAGTVSYIAPDDGRLRVAPGEEIPLPGQTVSMKAVIRSESYGTVLPRGALCGNEEQGYYVYTVEPCEGILGMEDRVRKIPVTLQEQNASYAAVSSPALNGESRVVAGSSKELQEDAAVRVLQD